MEDTSQPLKVNSIPEEYAYIASLRCEKCGGPYQTMKQSLLIKGTTSLDAIELVCQACGQEKRLLFDISSFFGK